MKLRTTERKVRLAGVLTSLSILAIFAGFSVAHLWQGRIDDALLTETMTLFVLCLLIAILLSFRTKGNIETALRQIAPAESVRHIGDDLVLLFQSNDLLRVEMLKQALESRMVPYRIAGEQIHNLLPFLPNASTNIFIRVEHLGIGLELLALLGEKWGVEFDNSPDRSDDTIV